MKKKSELHEKISRLEAEHLHYVWLGVLVRLLCYVIAIHAMLVGIGLAGLAGYEVLSNTASADASIRRFVYGTPLCGVVVLAVIALDHFVARPSLGRADVLSGRAYFLRKNGRGR